ncbi:MAG: DUF748 domain-containing protein [Methylophaga sp.]|nr:DUF748 domain-containing protein [Methylophaga sp.]
MKSVKTILLKYRALLIWGFGMVLLYTLLGFLLLPWLAERQLVKTMHERLAVDGSVEKIDFNPYTFEVTVNNLHLSDKQNEQLMAWDRLYINLQPLQLFLLKIRFEEITIDSPALYFRRYSASENTLTRLADSWNKTREGEEAEDTSEQEPVIAQDDPLFTLEIADFNYNDGQLAYRDDVPESQFETVLSPINIHLDDFSTEAGETASQDMIVALENDATLTLNGSMVLSPLQFTGQVDLDNFSLQIPYRYLQARLPFELQEGRLDLALAYDLDFSDTANIELSEINIDLSGFSLFQPGESTPLLQGGTLTASNGQFVYPDNQLSIDNINVADFQLAASRNSQGELNWLQTFAPLLDSETDDKLKEPESPPFELSIANLQIDNTALTLKDQQPDSPVNLGLMLSADVQDFSLSDNQQMSINTQISLDSGGDITVDGQMQLFPVLAVKADTGIEQLSLSPLQPYLNEYTHIEIVSGQLNSNASITTHQQMPFSIQGDLTLSQLQLDNQQLDKKLLSLDTLTINSFDFSQANLQLAISEVIVDAFDSLIVIDENGETNLKSLIKEQGNTATEDESPSLQLDIASLQINNAALALADQQPDSPVNLGLMLSADVQDFSLKDDQQIPFNTQISLESGGEITLEGQMQLFPTLAIQAETGIEQLSLLPLQPYLNQYAYVDMVSVKVDATARLSSNQQEPFSIQGDLTLSEVLLDNQQLDQKLISLDTLSVNSLDFSQANKKLAISEMIVDALYSRVLINENGETNIALLIKDQSSTEGAETATESFSDESDGYEFSLGRAEINNASSQFTDQNLPIVFDAYMQRLNGGISGFATSSEAPVDIALEGQVDEFGLVVIDGAMNPMDVFDDTMINLAFSNLDLPAMSPYTIKFAGRKIDEGRADVELTYEIVNGDLKASNDILIRDIVLGEKVDSPDALDLPLDLAVSLLENNEGVIEINIPVSGNLDDPQFAMGPVIREAIGAALKNIVTAPFRFLGSLVGIGNGDEPIDTIRFRAGRSDLTPPAQEKLQKLVDALSQRPQLALQIPAPFAESGDRQALKKSAVEARIEKRLNERASSEQLDLKRQQVLEALYLQAGLTPDLQTLKQAFLTEDATREQTEPELDRLAYNAALKKRLVESEPVTVAELKALGQQRQQTVMEFIQQNSQVKEDQLQTIESFATEFDDGWLKMKFDLETI